MNVLKKKEMVYIVLIYIIGLKHGLKKEILELKNLQIKSL